MRRIALILAAALLAVCASAQVDRREVREGNRKFRGGNFRQAEIDYRKAAVKDSLSVAAQYNLASSLYRQEEYEGAAKALETIKDVAPNHPNSADYFYNAGDVALQMENYQAAVEAFKQALLRNPDDLDAKENYIYAKKKMQDQEQEGGGDDKQDQNQDQDQDQNQDQQQQQQDQDQQQDQQQQQPREQKISPQQAQQMLNAIQAKEKETQDKVNKEKAQANPNKKEKNW
jgi:Ca-activated chloride channel family protein